MPASVVAGTAPAQVAPPDGLANSSYSGFTCDTGLIVIGNPLQPTASPTLTLTHPNTLQYYQPFTVTTSLDRPNPATYSMGGGLTQTIHAVYNIGLRLPVPLNAGQTAITLGGGSWNAAWGSAPALTNSNGYLQAAHVAGNAGVPGGNPVTIDLPDVNRQLVAIGNAGTTIPVTLPGSGDINSPTMFFQQRFSVTGPVGITNSNHAVRCLPAGGGNTVIVTIPITPLQPQLTLDANPPPIAAGSPLTLRVTQTSVSGVLDGGTVTFERVGGASVGTSTLAAGIASIVISAPTTVGPVSYRARWTSNGNANFLDATSADLPIQINAASPSAIATVSGSPQSVAPGQAFAPLVIRMRDAFNNPVPSALVSFGAPSTGASAVLSSTLALTNANGEASVNATANATAGSYVVTASFGSLQTTFNLSNVVPASLSATIAANQPLTIPAAAPGGSVGFSVALASTGTLPGPVQLSVTGLPAGSTASFANNNLVPPATTALTIQTTAATPLGTHPFTLVATSGSLSDTKTSGFYVTSTTAGAGVISIDFVGTGIPMMPIEMAGVVARPNWNIAQAATGSRDTLFDETGTATTLTIDWTSATGHALPIIDAPGNARMMAGYIDTMSSAATSIEVDGLPANAGGYLVYVYADGDNVSLGATRTGRYEVVANVLGDTRINIIDTASSNFSGSFLRALGGPGNYAVFPIRGTGFTLAATPLSSSDANLRAPVNAIQIVPADLLFFDGFD